MNRFSTAIRTLFLLPPVWVTLVVVGAAFATSGWAPFVDIARYAIERLFS
jgi:hypothetical protein